MYVNDKIQLKYLLNLVDKYFHNVLILILNIKYLKNKVYLNFYKYLNDEVFY
jgi:hypothetical protein